MSDLVVGTPAFIPTPVERRGTARHLANRICFAQANGTDVGMSWGVTLWDISTTGLSLILRVQLCEGMIVGIQPFRDTSIRPLVARIVRTLPHPDGWFYGCELLHPLSEADVQQWLSGAIPTRRCHSRENRKSQM
jgi:hypothetical protein